MTTIAAILFIVFAVMGSADLMKEHGCLGCLMVPVFLIVLALLCGALA